MLASDASHYYENMEATRPFPIVFDVPAMIAGYDRLRSLAGPGGVIVPGHDPDGVRAPPAGRPIAVRHRRSPRLTTVAYPGPMRIGLLIFPTDCGIQPVELAREAEVARIRFAVVPRAFAHPREPPHPHGVASSARHHCRPSTGELTTSS